MTRDAPRVRRPTDAVLLAVTGAVLAWSVRTVDDVNRGIYGAFARFLSDVPNLLDPIWQVLYDLLLGWALFLVILALVRRHLSLVRDHRIRGLPLVATTAVPVNVRTVAGRFTQFG